MDSAAITTATSVPKSINFFTIYLLLSSISKTRKMIALQASEQHPPKG
jgi:hypothetical protein